MVSMTDLWWQILLAGVICFFASFILWAVLPLKNTMFLGLGDAEDATLEHIRTRSLRPGMYCFPYCSGPKELKDPEMQRKFEQGPVGMLHIWTGRRPMTLCMGLTLLTMVLVSVMVAYLLSLSGLQPGAAYLRVFRFASAAAFLGYAFGGLPDAIWFGKSPKYVLMTLLDGVVYALLTAGVFAAFWPEAGAAALPA